MFLTRLFVIHIKQNTVNTVYNNYSGDPKKQSFLLCRCFSTFFFTGNPFDQKKLLKPFATEKKFAETLKSS